MSNNKKILIAEDDKFLGEIYSTNLSREAGFDVIIAKDGEEAFSLIKSELPDLVLLDVLMPKMSGLEVLEKMSRDQELDKVKVIMLTNVNEKDYVKRANKARRVDYLIKSGHTPGEVLEKIKQRLESDY